MSLSAWMGCGHSSLSPSPPSGGSLNRIQRLPADRATPAHERVLFTEVARAAGIDYRWTVEGKRPLNILQTIGNGCAFLDYDNDGNLDILLVGPKLALYRGDGKGHFTDVTHATGLDQLNGHFLGCAVGDFDNDGYEDLYISAYRGGVLLHNEPIAPETNSGTRNASVRRFRDVTQEAGIASQPWGTSATFTDFDGDGRLDLYIGNYAKFGPETQPQLCNNGTLMSACGPRFYYPLHGVLYHNLGGGRFRDVSVAWGLQHVSGKALGVAAADIRETGHPMLAISNDEMAGDLLEKQGAKFQNIAVAAGTAYDSAGQVHGGMGLDWGDYNNDGRLDLLVASFQHEAKNVYLNEGGGRFTDQATALGVADATMSNVAFGCKFIDVDNDGWLDIILANGHVQDNIGDIDKSTTYRQTIQLLRNIEGTRFEDVSVAAGSAFQAKIVGRGLATGDFDNDGRMDVLVADSEGTPMLLHNESPHSGHWLQVKLIGTKSNRDGIGALVTVQASERKILRRCATDGSYLSASDRRVHFGLGSAKQATITVRWPSGTVNIYPQVPADRIVTLKEGEAAFR